MNRIRSIRKWRTLHSAALLTIVLPVFFAGSGIAAVSGSVQHFKMCSTLEYSGEGDFRNAAETVFTADSQFVGGQKVRHVLSSSQFDMGGGFHNPVNPAGYNGVSFVFDRGSGLVSDISPVLASLQRESNQCTPALTVVTADNIGKTWKQRYENVSFIEGQQESIEFTVTAIPQMTDAYGEMVAVRALSGPVSVDIPKAGGGEAPFKFKVNSVYLFDAAMEKVYFGASVFDAETKASGFKEKLRYEMTAYQTDAAGNSVDLTGLDKKFEKLVRKVGLQRKALEIAEETTLPQLFTGGEVGISAIQISNMTAALACEGAHNPVALVYVPLAQVIAGQSLGAIGITGGAGTVSGSCAGAVAGMGFMDVTAAPTFLGITPLTGTLIGAGIAIPLALNGGGGSGSSGGSGAATSTVPDGVE